MANIAAAPVASGLQTLSGSRIKLAPSKDVKVQARGAVQVSCTAVAPEALKSIQSASIPKRVFNFSAGPATLPLEVLIKAQADLVNFQDSGMSVMEMSHRGKEFMGIAAKAEADLRTLLSIPENFAVLFLQGGASQQFSAVPLNLAGPEDTTDYIVTGSWGDKAIKEAQRLTKANLAASGKAGKYTDIPAFEEWKLTPGAKYVHICSNETIQGVEFKADPPLPEGTVLVADMSSNFCSKPIDVAKYGVIYAGAQKNIGPAGVTVAIVRKDLIGNAREGTPTMLDWKTQAENESMYNTPPCFAIYICGLVFEHLLQLGGLEAVEKANKEKAGILYNAIDGSNGFYKCPVQPAVRSLMNVPFTMATPELESAFLKEAGSQGMIQLKGHRSVGGVRASIYNAMPKEGVQQLVDFMEEFRTKNA